MASFRQHAFDAFVHGRCRSAGAQVTNIGVGGHQVDYETPTMRVAWQRSQCELYHEYDGICRPDAGDNPIYFPMCAY